MSTTLFFFVQSLATGEVIYVDADRPDGGNGQTWSTAFKYLQDALNNPYPGVEIRVAEGIYKPDQGEGQTSGDSTAAFLLINSMSLKGGYAGYSTPDPNERDIELYETILSGDLNGDDTPGIEPCNLHNDPCHGENSYHVVVLATNETVVFDGFTITAGFALDSGWLEGGGMFNSDGDLTIINCKFIGNVAGRGGGMYNSKSEPNITNCTFSGNLTVVAERVVAAVAVAVTNAAITFAVMQGKPVVTVPVVIAATAVMKKYVAVRARNVVLIQVLIAANLMKPAVKEIVVTQMIVSHALEAVV